MITHGPLSVSPQFYKVVLTSPRAAGPGPDITWGSANQKSVKPLGNRSCLVGSAGRIDQNFSPSVCGVPRGDNPPAGQSAEKGVARTMA